MSPDVEDDDDDFVPQRSACGKRRVEPAKAASSSRLSKQRRSFNPPGLLLSPTCSPAVPINLLRGDGVRGVTAAATACGNRQFTPQASHAVRHADKPSRTPLPAAITSSKQPCNSRPLGSRHTLASICSTGASLPAPACGISTGAPPDVPPAVSPVNDVDPAVSCINDPVDDAALCPVCYCRLSLISDTPAGRAEHVEACLDVDLQTQACPSDDDVADDGDSAGSDSPVDDEGDAACGLSDDVRTARVSDVDNHCIVVTADVPEVPHGGSAPGCSDVSKGNGRQLSVVLEVPAMAMFGLLEGPGSTGDSDSEQPRSDRGNSDGSRPSSGQAYDVERGVSGLHDERDGDQWDEEQYSCGQRDNMQYECGQQDDRQYDCALQDDWQDDFGRQDDGQYDREQQEDRQYNSEQQEDTQYNSEPQEDTRYPRGQQDGKRWDAWGGEQRHGGDGGPSCGDCSALINLCQDDEGLPQEECKVPGSAIPVGRTINAWGVTVGVLPPDDAAALSEWLHRHGLLRHAAALVREEVDLMAVPLLDDADLQELGVSDRHERARFLSAALLLPCPVRSCIGRPAAPQGGGGFKAATDVPWQLQPQQLQGCLAPDVATASTGGLAMAQGGGAPPPQAAAGVPDVQIVHPQPPEREWRDVDLDGHTHQQQQQQRQQRQQQPPDSGWRSASRDTYPHHQQQLGAPQRQQQQQQQHSQPQVHVGYSGGTASLPQAPPPESVLSVPTPSAVQQDVGSVLGKTQRQAPPLTAGNGRMPQGSSAFSSMFKQHDTLPVRITDYMDTRGSSFATAAAPAANNHHGAAPPRQFYTTPHRQQQPLQPLQHTAPPASRNRAGAGGNAVGIVCNRGGALQPALLPHGRAPPAPLAGGAARQHGGAGAAAPLPLPSSSYQCLPRCIPRWHTIPGTKFVVDKFGRSVADVRGCQYWFLTHFHADHYMGLTKHFNQGVVVCNAVTAELVSAKLKVPWAKLLVVPMDTPTLVDGVTITLIDANHCPGAAMIVAELLPRGAPPVLHTGDCRLLPDMQSHPALLRIRGRAILVLDTTYCDPTYCFPSQVDTLRFALQAAKSESFSPRTLLLFGTYTIGKERLFLEVAKSLGKKVYVSKEKMAILRCCNLAPEYERLLTTNHLETNLHAVPLFKVSLQNMGEILNQYKGRYSTIVGFQPTGWSHGKEQKSGQCGKRTQRGTMVLYQVPYSEHSSFAELRQFVAWFRPVELLPSVGNDGAGGAKTQRMIELLTQERAAGPLGALAAAATAATSSIKAFFKPKAPTAAS